MRNFLLSIACTLLSLASFAQVGPIMGAPFSVCQGGTTTLSCAPGGGTWTSSNPSVASIGSSTGFVTGNSAGVVTITYSAGSTGSATQTFTVNPLPSGISGPATLCEGDVATYISSPSGGTWSSGSPAIATVGSLTGDVTAVSAGSTIITYTLATGCYVISSIGVNPLPGAISGTGAVCVGSTLTATSATPGGVWSSSGVVATVGSSSGLVTGVSAGVETIAYTLSTGCLVTATVTVDPVAGPISGTTTICAGSCVSLFGATTGGVWTSTFPGVATVGPSSGLLCGVSAGVTSITYTIGVCSDVVTVTVNPLPAAITGATSMCAGASVTLSSTTVGGMWSSSGTFATVGATTGIVTGTSAGVETITYTLPTGCFVTHTVTVNVMPAPISGSTGGIFVCMGSAITLSSATPGGTWTSSSPSVASVGATTGVVSSVSLGVTTITYAIGSCFVTAVVSVNPMPTPITGTSPICSGSSATFSSTPGGGLWSSSTPAIAGVGATTGVVTGASAGAATITYLLPGGCFVTKTVSVHPLPGAITGTATACIGATTLLSSTTPGGTWSSSNVTVATIGSTGLVTGVTSGTATITYMIGTGCYQTVSLTVVSSPMPITGPSTACVFGTIPLTSGTPGGTWISSYPAIATVGSTGVVTGVTTGPVTITYSLGSGCFTTSSIVVHPLPAPITGPMIACVGYITNLNNASPGGTWTSSGVNATVGASTGIVTGISAGIEIITYTLPTGCFTTATVTVNIAPCPTLGMATTGSSHIAEIFPNPAYDEITIKMDEGAYSSVVISNSVGQVFIHQQINAAQTRVDISALPSAVYYVALRGPYGSVVQKVVKQ